MLMLLFYVHLDLSLAVFTITFAVFKVQWIGIVIVFASFSHSYFKDGTQIKT